MVLLVKSIKLLQKELFIIFLYNGKLYIKKHKTLGIVFCSVNLSACRQTMDTPEAWG